MGKRKTHGCAPCSRDSTTRHSGWLSVIVQLAMCSRSLTQTGTGKFGYKTSILRISEAWGRRRVTSMIDGPKCQRNSMNSHGYGWFLKSRLLQILVKWRSI
jgi:hypothetical protein